MWQEMTRILCDKYITYKAKEKLFKTIVRLAIVYGSECLAINEKGDKIESCKNDIAKVDM